MLKAGLVGFGYWGPKLAKALVATGDVRLKWICDSNPEQASSAREQCPNAQFTTIVTPLIEDAEVELIVIATPAATHYELATTALLANKDVFIEKPISATAAQALSLAEIASRKQRICMVGHVTLYDGNFHGLRWLVKSANLGPIDRIAIRRRNPGPVRSDVDALWDLGSHDIACLLDLFGELKSGRILRRQAQLGAMSDEVDCEMEFSAAHHVSLVTSWHYPIKERIWEIHGQKGHLFWDATASNPLSGVINGRIIAIPQTPKEPLLIQMRHLLTCLRLRVAPKTDAFFGAKVLQCLQDFKDITPHGLLDDGSLYSSD